MYAVHDGTDCCLLSPKHAFAKHRRVGGEGEGEGEGGMEGVGKGLCPIPSKMLVKLLCLMHADPIIDNLYITSPKGIY